MLNPTILIQLLLFMCNALVFPSALLGQASKPTHEKGHSVAPLQHDSDIPVMGTAEEKAEAKQAEAKEEALKSLFVHGRYTVLPLPAFAYSRNESYWAGAVVPILQSNAQDELHNIYAPFYTHNRYVGETLGINYYGYPSDTEQYSATASYSTQVQRDIDLGAV